MLRERNAYSHAEEVDPHIVFDVLHHLAMNNYTEQRTPRIAERQTEQGTHHQPGNTSQTARHNQRVHRLDTYSMVGRPREKLLAEHAEPRVPRKRENELLIDIL